MSASSDLRNRVLLCLNKLSDRDTLPLAIAELESIARGLTPGSFSLFLSSLDSAEEPRVRRQCVRIMGFLSETHGDSLSPHVPRIMSSVVRRLRDSDSALRAACVNCVSSMASKTTKPPFSSFLKPLVDALLHEQDRNSQIGSALCLAAAIDAAPDPEPELLQNILPKLLKLVTKNGFKAKAALLSLIGSVASAGGAANHGLLGGLVSCLVSFLSSEDWAARKAAAEALSSLAVVEREMSTTFRASCLASLENRRFDKVKIVRDTMNNTLKVWKEVPEMVSPQSPCRTSSKDDSDVTSSPLSRSTSSDELETPQPKKSYSKSSPTSSNNSFPTTTRKKSPIICDKKPNVTLFSKNERNSVLKLETRRALFRKKFDEKISKSQSRVVPFYENEYCEPDVVQFNDTRENDLNKKEIENMNMIRQQLLQIENQQSNLLQLLQRFMGSSQSGMNQLENRVNGLEKSLDEISQNLELSTGRILNTEFSENSCCRLPGAEFLSPKFWRRTESQYTYSTFSLSQRNHSLAVTSANVEMQKMDIPFRNNQVNIQGKI